MKHADKYPMSMIVLHSLVALAMIGALLIGWNLSPELMPIHKALGIAVLIFAVLRIANRFRVASHVPASVNSKGSMQYILEKSVHGLLYITMIGAPLFGWLLSNAHGYPANFFGLFSLPTLIAKDPSITRTLKDLHELCANVFFGLLILHVVGGVVHLLKEKKNVFKRMMPF